MPNQQSSLTGSAAGLVLSPPRLALLSIALATAYSLAGITALSYEVLWVRMLSLQFGVSSFGVMVTVGAFMAGLGLGSLAGVRLGARLRSPLTTFALLEGSVAVYALILPSLQAALDAWLGAAADPLGAAQPLAPLGGRW